MLHRIQNTNYNQIQTQCSLPLPLFPPGLELWILRFDLEWQYLGECSNIVLKWPLPPPAQWEDQCLNLTPGWFLHLLFLNRRGRRRGWLPSSELNWTRHIVWFYSFKLKESRGLHSLTSYCLWRGDTEDRDLKPKPDNRNFSTLTGPQYRHYCTTLLTSGKRNEVSSGTIYPELIRFQFLNPAVCTDHVEEIKLPVFPL